MGNQKTNGVLIGTLVFFIMLSISLGGFIVYDKFFIKDNTVRDSDLDSSKEENDLIKSKISVTDFSFDSVAIVSDGSVYVSINGNTLDIDNLFGGGTFQTLVATRKKYKDYAFDNFEYYKGNHSFKGMKLNVSNVESVYTYEAGQVMQKNNGLILLNKDKTLSIISLYSLIHGKTDVKHISNLSDITSIVSEDEEGIVTYAIKENGQKINLEDYIPEDCKQF